MHNENSNPDGSNQGGTMGKDGEEASGLDKLLTLFPSTPQAGKPGGGGKDEDTASEADYKCNEIKDSVSESGKAEDATAAAATPQSANVDVHNLFAQLLGAGLVKGDDGEKAKDGKAVIPGLEVKNSEPSAKEKKKDKAKVGEEDKGAEEGESEEFRLPNRRSFGCCRRFQRTPVSL